MTIEDYSKHSHYNILTEYKKTPLTKVKNIAKKDIRK